MSDPITGFRSTINHRQYDLTLDGESFLMLRQAGEAVQWVAALNWP